MSGDNHVPFDDFTELPARQEVLDTAVLLDGPNNDLGN